VTNSIVKILKMFASHSFPNRRPTPSECEKTIKKNVRSQDNSDTEIDKLCPVCREEPLSSPEDNLCYLCMMCTDQLSDAIDDYYEEKREEFEDYKTSLLNTEWADEYECESLEFDR